MKTEHIREFLTLAEELNYTSAAQKLFISQSALSRHVVALEEELGIELLERTSHEVRLTPFGAEAVALLGEMDRTRSDLMRLAEERRHRIAGRLVFGVLYYSLDHYFEGFIPYFREQYPDVELVVRTFQPHELYQQLLKGSVDVGELMHAHYPDVERFQVRDFSPPQEALAIMTADHPLAQRESVTLDDIANEVFVELREDYCSRIAVREMLDRAGVVFPRTVATDNIETVGMTLKREGGVSLSGSDARHQAKSSLAYVPVSDKRMRYRDAFFWRKGSTDPLVKLFVDEYFKFKG